MNKDMDLGVDFLEELELTLSISLSAPSSVGTSGSTEQSPSSQVNHSLMHMPLLSVAQTMSGASGKNAVEMLGLEAITEESIAEINAEIDPDKNHVEGSLEERKPAGRQLAMTAWLIGRAERSPTVAKSLTNQFLEAGVETVSVLAQKIQEEQQQHQQEMKEETKEEMKGQVEGPGLLTGGLSCSDSDAITGALIKRRRERRRHHRLCKALVSALSTSSSTQDSAPQLSLLEEQCMCTVHMQGVIDSFKDEVSTLPQGMEVFRATVKSIDDFMRLSQGCSAELQIALGQRGICAQVSTLISLFLKSSERLLQNAFRVVCLLCCRALDDPAAYIYENIEIFGQTDVVKVSAVSAMLKYEDSLLVTKWTTKTVRILSCLKTNRVQLGSCGVCHALLHVGNRYTSSSPNDVAVLWVMDAIERVCEDNLENKLSFLHHGICAFVQQAMIRFVLVESVVVKGCVLLQMILTARDSHDPNEQEMQASHEDCSAEDEALRLKLLDLNICEVLSDCLVMYQKKSSQYLQTKTCGGDRVSNQKELAGDSNQDNCRSRALSESEEVILDASSHLHSVHGSDVFVEVCRTLIILLRPGSSSSHAVAARLCQDRSIFQALMSPLLASPVKADTTHIATIHLQHAALWCLKAAHSLCNNILACEGLLAGGVCEAVSSVLSVDDGVVSSNVHLPIVKSALRLTILLCGVPIETSKLLDSIHSSTLLQTLIGLICKHNRACRGGRGGQNGGKNGFSLLLHDLQLAELLVLALRSVVTLLPIEDCSSPQKKSKAPNSLGQLISRTNQKIISLGGIPCLLSVLTSHTLHSHQVTTCGGTVRVVSHAAVTLGALLECDSESTEKTTGAVVGVEDCSVIVGSLRFLLKQLLIASSHDRTDSDDSAEERGGNRDAVNNLYRAVAYALLAVNHLSELSANMLQECFGTLGVCDLIIQILAIVHEKQFACSRDDRSQVGTGDSCRELLHQVCEAVRLVSRRDLPLGLQLGASGACDGLLRLLTHFYTDESVSEDVIRALVLLTSSARCRALNMRAVDEGKVLEDPVAAPQLLLPHSPLKKAKPTDLISNVAHLLVGGGDSGPLGVFEVLVRAFGFHVVQHEQIASQGCQLLQNIYQYMTTLKADRDHKQGLKEKQLSGEEDSVEQQDAHESFSQQTSTTRIGDTLCKTLYNLVIMALGSHLKCAAVQRDCILAVNGLLRLNDYSPNNLKLLSELSYPGILVNALGEHKQDAQIVSAAMSALIELIKDENSVLRDKLSCSAIINAVIFWVNDQDVVEFGCKLIYEIASNDVCRTLLYECKAPYALLIVLEMYSSPFQAAASTSHAKPTPRAAYRDVQVIKQAVMATLAISQLDKNLFAFTDLKKQTASFVATASSSSFGARLAARPRDAVDGDEGLDICSILASVLMTFRSTGEVVGLVLEMILMLGALKLPPSQASSVARKRRSTKDTVQTLPQQPSSSHLLSSSSLLLQMEDIPLHTSFAARSRLLHVQLHVLVQDMMEFHVSDIPILTLGCECLAMMASDDVGAKAIGEDEEVCMVVCNVLRASLGGQQHLEAVVSKAIGNIARYPVNTLVLADNGVCEMLVKSLQAYYTTSAAHVKEVCLSIAYLCRFNTSNKISLATSGACKLIHECFILYINNESVIPAVMFAIVALSHHNKYNLQQFSALGVTDFILELYIGSGLVAQTNEALVALILWFIGHVQPTSLEMLTSPEVCQFTLRNIHHRSNPVTVAYGCTAVTALARCTSKRNHRLLIDMHVIEVLQELPEVAFRQHDAVLTNSLIALASLVDSVSVYQDRVSVSAVVAVMEDNYLSRDVIEAALTALLSVFNGNASTKCTESNRKTITSPVTVKIIMDCARHHVTFDAVAQKGCQLVTLLCSRFKFIHKEWLEFGVCPLIVDAFKVHKRTLSVLHEACSAALVMCQLSPAAVSALCELGLISTLAALLRNFATKEALVCSTCTLVAAMAQQHGLKWAALGTGSLGGGGNSSNGQSFLEAGFALVVVEILQMYAAAGAGAGDGPTSQQEPFCGSSSTQGDSSSLPNYHHQILERAIEIVGSLSSMDAKLCEELEAAGVCECVLLLLIKSSAQGVRVLKATLSAVQQLAKHADTRQRLVDIQVPEHIDQAVGAHLSAPLAVQKNKESSSTSTSNDADDDTLLKLAKKTKAILMGQSFLQRNIGMPF